MAWRDHPYRYVGYLYFDRPEVLVKARVNQSSFTYPLYQVTIDSITVGASSDFIAGLTVLFGSADGLDDLGRTYLRRGSTATNLVVGESSNGVRDGELNLADNAYVTVLNDRRVWIAPPRIDDDLEIFKFYDIPATDSGRNYGERPGPIANGGCSKIALVDSVSGLATFDFDAADAYLVTPGSTKAGQTWEVQDGTITVGTSTSEQITATFPVGRRYVELEVEDSEGDTHTRYILVVALDVDDATWKPILDFEIVSGLRLSPEGAEMSVIVHETIAPITYPEGAAILYFETEYYNDVEGSLAGPDTAQQVKFVGWSDMEREGVEATFQGLQNGVEIRCISTAERLRKVNLLPQQVETSASPSDWTEMLTLTDQRLMFYLLKWHSTVLDVAPLLFNQEDIGEVAIVGWNTSAADLYGQVDEVAQSRGGRLTCDQRGQLRREFDPMLQAENNRTEVVIESLTSADIDIVTLERDRHPRDYWIDGSGIITGATGDPVFCIAPGGAPGQGSQRGDFSKQVIASQTELNERTGHYYAKLNAAWLPVVVKLHNWGDIGIDPALMAWVELTLTTATNRRSRSFTAARCLPLETSISYSIDDQGRRSKEVEVTLLVETIGQPAQTVVHPKGDANYPPILLPVITFPSLDFEFGIFARGIGNVAAIDGQKVHRTSNFYTPSAAGGPTWTTVNLSASLSAGDIMDFAVDYFSPLYLGTGSTVNGWLLVEGTAAARGIWRLSDIFGACTVTKRVALRGHSISTTVQNCANIVSPFKLGSANRVYAAYRTRAGVYNLYSTDDSTYTFGPQPIGGVSIGASLETLNIPVDGTTVTTATSLTSGTYYLLRVVGTAQKNAVGPLLMDAVYHETSPGTWVQSNNAVGSNLIVAGSATSENNIPVSNVYDGATHSYDFILFGTGATVTLGARQYGAAQTGTWTADLYPFNYPSGAINAPGLFGSSITDGLLYTSAFVGAAGDGYKSTDHGATWAALGTPDINTDDNLAGCIHVPYDNNTNEYLVLHGSYDTTGTVRKLIRVESDGTTKTDISPQVSGTKYGPRNSYDIATWAQDRRYIMMLGWAGVGTVTRGGFISRDAGSSWVNFSDLFSGGMFSSNDYNALYLWGDGGGGGGEIKVAYSEDFGVTIDSRVGNASMGGIFALVGG